MPRLVSQTVHVRGIDDLIEDDDRLPLQAFYIDALRTEYRPPRCRCPPVGELDGLYPRSRQSGSLQGGSSEVRRPSLVQEDNRQNDLFQARHKAMASI